jgi:hypothetical protein
MLRYIYIRICDASRQLQQLGIPEFVVATVDNSLHVTPPQTTAGLWLSGSCSACMLADCPIV